MIARPVAARLSHVLVLLVLPIACGNVTAEGPDGGGTGGTNNQGTAGTSGTSVDAGGPNGLLGNYSGGHAGAPSMTRVDPTIDFDPGPVGFEPAEVSWTGEINVVPGTSLQMSGNATDQLSIYVHNLYYSNGEAFGTGQVTTVISTYISGWSSITIDIKRTDLTSPFKAVLTQQLMTDGAVTPPEPVPTEDLRPQ